MAEGVGFALVWEGAWGWRPQGASSEPHPETDSNDQKVLPFGEVVIDAGKNRVLPFAEEEIPGEPSPKDEVVLATLAHALSTSDKKRGLATLCIGGGEAVAVIIERA